VPLRFKQAQLPDGQLTFGVGIGSHQTSRDRCFRESVGFSISCETAKSSDQLNGDYVYPLHNLMTFVCDRPQEVSTRRPVACSLGFSTVLRPTSTWPSRALSKPFTCTIHAGMMALWEGPKRRGG
jgi:hypothetical protein